MSRAAAWAALHVAVLLFGFAGLFGKWLALSPLLIVFARTAIAAAALGALRFSRHATRAPFEWPLLGNGAVLAVHWLSFFMAIQVSDVATGLLGYATFPLFTLLLTRAFDRAPVTGRNWATAGLVVFGLALMVPEFSFANRAAVGLFWGLVSGATFALLAVMNRRQSLRRSPGDLAYWQNLCAAITLLPVACVAAASLPEGTSVPGGREIVLLLALGLLCTALAHTLFIASLREVGTHLASVVAALEPVYGIVLAFVLLGETPAPRVLAGGALIIAAAIVATGRGSARA
jgi:drug/metabolite transporter (DMT)-like permease